MLKKTPQQWADGLLSLLDNWRADHEGAKKKQDLQWATELFAFEDEMREDLGNGAQAFPSMAKAEPASGLLHTLPSQSSGIANDAAAPGGLRGAFDDINPGR
ncbi:MAG: hypothetical protein ABSB63_22910 [Spirochaetia bacterium]|jgi:hypothetical protein